MTAATEALAYLTEARHSVHLLLGRALDADDPASVRLAALEVLSALDAAEQEIATIVRAHAPIP